LSAAAFRVYCHLSRRDGLAGAWAAVKTIASVCRLHPQTVRKALRLLTRHHLVSREFRCGQTTVYRLTPASAWQPPTHIDGDPGETDTKASVSAGGLPKGIQVKPSETEVAKGNPIEGYPKKVNPHSPPRRDCVNDNVSMTSPEEEIYAAYPRKIGQPVALRAIRRALSKRPYEFLLERTRLFAQTCNSPAEFIPHPTTWFNQARFNDEPATWRRTGFGNAKPPPPIVRPDNFGCGVAKL
jgi:hypothetical protein